MDLYKVTGKSVLIEYGESFKRKGFTFISSNDSLWVTEFTDWTLLTNSDFTPHISSAPTSLKEAIHSRWLYNLHLSNTPSSEITQENMIQRVNGGEILAYKFLSKKPYTLGGNDFVYCGFIPTFLPKTDEIEGTHKKCRFAMQEIFPNRLYVYLKQLPGRCPHTFSLDPEVAKLHKNCKQWSSKTIYGTEDCWCVGEIDWSSVYVFKGEPDETCLQMFKETRECERCAQCYKCTVSAEYCRKHRVCKHKKSVPHDQIVNYESPKIKYCKRKSKKM